MRTRTRGIAATGAALVVAGAFMAASASASTANDAQNSTGAIALPASAVAPSAVEEPIGLITSDGPLTFIEVAPDLTCQVGHIADRLAEFDDVRACATLVADPENELLFGPETVPGGIREALETWTGIDQESGGSGTLEDPFFIRTVVENGYLLVTQTDTYVTGEDSYRTNIEILAREVPFEAVVYHAADCRVQNNDEGLGSFSPDNGAVTCHAPGASGQIEPGGRVEEFVPLTPDSNFFYADADEMWKYLTTGRPLPDSVNQEGRVIDHAMALSWVIPVDFENPGSVTFRTSFPAAETLPLAPALTLSTADPAVDEPFEITVTIDNPNGFTQGISSLQVALPAGTNYVEGSTVNIPEPSVLRSTLNFGAVTIAPEQQLDFSFLVVSTRAGDATLTLSGSLRDGTPVEALGFFSARDVVPPPPPPTEFDPWPVLLGGGGGVLLLIVTVTTIAMIRSRRLQKKLVREHVRLEPKQARTIHHTSTPDVPAPTPPSFHLVGEPGVWEHRVIEEEP